MIKKTITSILMLVLVFTFSNIVNAQESENYAMWQTIMITPDYANLETLQTNMRKHNETYHKEGPYKATVFNITTGPNAGKMIWQMGPMMFKDNDGRPSGDGHDDSWRDTVMPYVKEMHTIEYWSQDNEKSNTAMLSGPEFSHPILFIRYFEINTEHGYTMDAHFKEISETIKSMDGEHPWGLYWRSLNSSPEIMMRIAIFSCHNTSGTTMMKPCFAIRSLTIIFKLLD